MEYFISGALVGIVIGYFIKLFAVEAKAKAQAEAAKIEADVKAEIDKAKAKL